MRSTEKIMEEHYREQAQATVMGIVIILCLFAFLFGIFFMIGSDQEDLEEHKTIYKDGDFPITIYNDGEKVALEFELGSNDKALITLKKDGQVVDTKGDKCNQKGECYVTLDSSLLLKGDYTGEVKSDSVKGNFTFTILSN